MSSPANLSIAALRARYLARDEIPARVMDRLLETSADPDVRNVWITRLSREQVMGYVSALDPDAIERLPLYGVPFVIKDNIDLAGIPTTAGCPGFAYEPRGTATVVQRLIDAGAIPLGKTNLDQFATGLVGTRSPYGACRNSVDAQFIAGGSSSGSAVAVATGLASFALGTDTAGSGRVPAAFNNIVGLKPSHGRLSTRGVVPACRSLDCVSIFALTAEDAAVVLDAAESFDAADPYSCRMGNTTLAGFRVGVPPREQRQFFGDADYQRLFAESLQHVKALGGSVIEVDFEPFFAAARLLYEGPWIAERYAAVGAFIEAQPQAVYPVTRQIIEAGKLPTGAQTFAGEYQLRGFKRQSEAAWSAVDLLLTPTAGTIYRISEVEADPIQLNRNLGYYTNFMNLLDLCGVAVPSGFRTDGMPFGVTLIGPRATERALLDVAGRLHRTAVATVGALGCPLPPHLEPRSAVPSHLNSPSPEPPQLKPQSAEPPRSEPPSPVPAHLKAPASPARDEVMLAVCGAHMQGLPLNHQLRDRGGRLLAIASTAPLYRLYALPGGPPHRPGLLRVATGGAAIELEIWGLPADQVGAFVAAIPAPLGVGKIDLDSGAVVTGFLCEAYAADGAADITHHGGWRAYLEVAHA
jgi:allophanate hydrolase